MNVNVELSIEPDCARCCDLLTARPGGRWNGRSLEAWRRTTRGELGLPADRPIIATGHQTLLWHPGILAKYLLVDTIAAAQERVATANLIVDQHTSAFGQFEVPVRRSDGSLAVHTITLTAHRHDVPMGLHPSFVPPAIPPDLAVALASIQTGIERIVAAVAAHRGQDNAALQMAAAMADLMSRWVSPMPNVSSTDLINTSLARTILERMADDPRACAACYNEAVAAVPEGGIGPLAIADDLVELPLWRVGPDGRRRAYGGDVRRWLDRGGADDALLPRALFLTGLVRVGMCDLFVHGTGGATYDRAMVLWLGDWLGLEPCPVAVATATLRLPLDAADEATLRLEPALHATRRVWHDPESAGDAPSPGPTKRTLLGQINAAPRRSPKRQALFGQMHERLAELRRERADQVEAARLRAEAAARHAAEAPIINRRTWPFPLYPDEMIDALAEAVAQAAAQAGAKQPTAGGSVTAGPQMESPATLT